MIERVHVYVQPSLRDEAELGMRCYPAFKGWAKVMPPLRGSNESLISPRYLTVKESIFPPLDPMAVSLITFVPALRETGEEEMLQLVQVPVDGKGRLPFTTV